MSCPCFGVSTGPFCLFFGMVGAHTYHGNLTSLEINPEPVDIESGALTIKLSHHLYLIVLALSVCSFFSIHQNHIATD